MSLDEASLANIASDTGNDSAADVSLPVNSHEVAVSGSGGGTSRIRSWVGVWGVVFVCSWAGNQFSPLLLMYQDRDHYTALQVNAFLGVYVLGLAPALLIAGSLSDRHGRRPVMLVGILAAIVGSALLAFEPVGAEFLVVGRLFSGVAVGIAMAVGNSWVKELSQAPFDPDADASAGARRAALAFTLGSAVGAVVAGLLAQWGPYPEQLPFVIHIAVTLPFVLVLLRSPESHLSGRSTSGAWWRELRVPSAGHRRFVRVVVPAAPWIFAAAAIGYGYLPTQLRGVTGSWGLVFATAATAVALGVSSTIQPIAKRVHSTGSARGLGLGVLLLVIGIAVVAVAIVQQSIWIGLAANVVIGAGLGISLVSGLLEVQLIASREDLAGLTGVFYAVAYVGFLAPAVIAAISGFAPVLWILGAVVVLGMISCVVLMASSTKHLEPALSL
ncbi:MFS transporter [Occultella kanbiaonis]|uniref:MFS transporter n=1 Tax=Occultella kanbiaonis TaxID=2675754 RepID=UPI0014089A6F|nr:MFS transporter [Occultella kanbiaonis]